MAVILPQSRQNDIFLQAFNKLLNKQSMCPLFETPRRSVIISRSVSPVPEGQQKSSVANRNCQSQVL